MRCYSCRFLVVVEATELTLGGVVDRDGRAKRHAGPTFLGVKGSRRGVRS